MQKVNVYDNEGISVKETLERPELFNIELRSDLVQRVHDNVRQNARQPYAVSPNAGMQHSAEGWGTGRAVARVPRVKASGTRRAGQAAFANFARKGRMAHPTQVNRRWTRKTNKNLRRLVSCMGIAASANPAIVEGRGHRIENIKSFPIVVDDSISTITKTKDALKLLVNLGLGDDLKKVKDSKTITSGKGKWRNRKYTERVGLLLVHDGETEMKAFSNITGVELAKVDSLNLLTLCSGGRLGRLIVYTKSAFMKLSTIYSDEGKKGFSLPDNMISIDNLDEYFYSPEIQSLINVPSLLPKGTTKKSKEELEKINEMIEMF